MEYKKLPRSCYRNLSPPLTSVGRLLFFFLLVPPPLPFTFRRPTTFLPLYLSPYHLLSSSPSPSPPLDANRYLSTTAERIPPHSQAPESSSTAKVRAQVPPRSSPACSSPLFRHRESFAGFSGALFSCLFESGYAASRSRAEFGSYLVWLIARASVRTCCEPHPAGLCTRSHCRFRGMGASGWAWRACDGLWDDAEAFLSTRGKHSLVGMVNCLVVPGRLFLVGRLTDIVSFGQVR